MKNFRIIFIAIGILFFHSFAYADCVERVVITGEEQHGQTIDPYYDLSLDYADFETGVTVFNSAHSNIDSLVTQISNYLNAGIPNINNPDYYVYKAGGYIWVQNMETGESFSVTPEHAQKILNYFDPSRSTVNANAGPVYEITLGYCDPPYEQVYNPWEHDNNPFNHGGENDTGAMTSVPVNLPDSCPTDSSVKIMGAALIKMYPKINRGIAEEVSNYINLYKDQFHIIGRKELAYFMSQVMAETDGFRAVVEDYNYSRKNIRKNFRDRIPDSTKWDGFVNCQCLFNFVYGNRYGNGDSASGDGIKYRGRGIMQITFKESYDGFTKYVNNHSIDNTDFVANPELIGSNLKYAVLAASWEFGVDKRRGKHSKWKRIDDAIAADSIEEYRKS